MTAEDIMTNDVLTIEETSSIGDAMQTMQEASIRHLPVVRGREVVGMLSDRDFRSLGLDAVMDMETMDAVRTRLSASVLTLMSGNVLSVDQSADIKDIIDLMVDEKIGAVPVIDEDTNDLVGLVSYIDVLRALRDEL
jgi:acetoin utilization protein AcuB